MTNGEEGCRWCEPEEWWHSMRRTIYPWGALVPWLFRKTSLPFLPSNNSNICAHHLILGLDCTYFFDSLGNLSASATKKSENQKGKPKRQNLFSPLCFECRVKTTSSPPRGLIQVPFLHFFPSSSFSLSIFFYDSSV